MAASCRVVMTRGARSGLAGCETRSRATGTSAAAPVRRAAMTTQTDVLEPAAPPPVDPARIEAVAGQLVAELGVTLSTLTTALGVRTGLWSALAGAGPLSPGELARRVGTAEPYAREWCRTQAAAGLLRYDDGRFELPAEVAAVLVHGPMGAMVDAAVTMLSATSVRLPAFEDAVRTGRGFGWDERAAEHWQGVDAFTG